MILLSQLKKLLHSYWQPLALYGGLLVVFAGLLWVGLGSLTGGYSSDEVATLQASTSLRHIIENPLNAPFTLLTRGFLLLGEHSAFWARAAATVFGLLTLSVFYWLARYWHGERSAILGTIMLGCSAWFLHTARLGTPGVLLFGLLGLLACALWLKRTENPAVLLIMAVLAALLIYVPGMIWVIVLGCIWQWKTILNGIRHQWKVSLAALVGLLALLTPLIMAIYRTPEFAKLIAGLPSQGWPAPLEVLKRLAMIPINLFVRGPLDPQTWLGRLPLLDVFSAAMLLLGIYLYARHFRLVRTQLVAAALVISCVLISFGGGVSISSIMPFVYLFVAAGIGFMLDRWHSVFPRNIIAQSVGVGLIGLTVAASCWYGIRQYLVAWPAAPATKQVFVIQQSQSLSDTIKK